MERYLKFEGRHREARFWDGKFHDEMVYGVLDYEYFGVVKLKSETTL
jgi:hypothetical protein